MSNLFSIFDPSGFGGSLPLKWSASIMVLFFMPSLYWVGGGRRSVSASMLLKEFSANVKPIFSGASAPGIMFVPSVLFYYICHNNLWGMSPFFFTSSSHLVFCSSLALPLWLGHMVFSFSIQPMFMMAHLVPLGTPAVLMPFMVVIELVSNLIRPITLAVRLTANMIAGHLLLVLLSSQMVSASYLVLLCILPALFALWLLESAVAVIQAYVFSTLSSLYLAEVNSLKLNQSFSKE